jgi:predicted PolB exonuclease-like 3'-5' exonuclease
MLENIRFDKVLFLDIETVPALPSYDDLSDSFKPFWDKKSQLFRKESETPSDVYQRAGIYAEFGKIICISFAMINIRNNEKILRIKSFYGDDEMKLLTDFSDMLKKITVSNDVYLCAHNGKEFDFPFMARRMMINSIRIPTILDSAGKKPWETQYLDTMELSPKDDIDGSMVADVYYKEKNIKRIVSYCEKDVIAISQLFMRYKNEPLILDSKIETTTEF